MLWEVRNYVPVRSEALRATPARAPLRRTWQHDLDNCYVPLCGHAAKSMLSSACSA